MTAKKTKAALSPEQSAVQARHDAAHPGLICSKCPVTTAHVDSLRTIADSMHRRQERRTRRRLFVRRLLSGSSGESGVR